MQSAPETGKSTTTAKEATSMQLEKGEAGKAAYAKSALVDDDRTKDSDMNDSREESPTTPTGPFVDVGTTPDDPTTTDLANSTTGVGQATPPIWCQERERS